MSQFAGARVPFQQLGSDLSKPAARGSGGIERISAICSAVAHVQPRDGAAVNLFPLLLPYVPQVDLPQQTERQLAAGAALTATGAVAQPHEFDVAQHRIAEVEAHDASGLVAKEAHRDHASLKSVAIDRPEFENRGRRIIEAAH